MSNMEAEKKTDQVGEHDHAADQSATKLREEVINKVPPVEKSALDHPTLPKLDIITNEAKPEGPAKSAEANGEGTHNPEQTESWTDWAKGLWKWGWDKLHGYPKETTDKDGNKTTDYGDGHTKIENKNGSGYERWSDKDGNYREVHHGSKPEDNYRVEGDGKGNKTIDWGGGHTKVEKADGTGYEHFAQPGGGYLEKHFGPKQEDRFTVSADKSGNKTTFYGNGHTKVEKADGTGRERWVNGDGSYKENHWGPKAEDNYKVEADANGKKTTDYGNGHTKIENKDGTGYDRYQYDDGTTLEKHFGPKKDDNYTLSTDADGNKKYDYGDGRTRVENKDGTGYDRTKNEDGSFTEKHFGTKPEDNFTSTIDKDGKRVDQKLSKEQEAEAQVKRGEGPFQVAERLLGKNASHEEIMALAKAMKEEYARTHPNDKSMRGLKVKEQLLSTQNLQQVLDHITNPEIKKKLAAMFR